MAGSSNDQQDDLEQVFADVRQALGPLDDVSGSSDGSAHRLEKHSSASMTAFPNEMSCTQAFDQLLKCYSIPGQIRNYYRYGEIDLCKERVAKFKFCLGSKLQGEEARKEAVKQWHMRRLAEKQTLHKSSEEIWSSRDAPLRLPFREDTIDLVHEGEDKS